MKLLSLLGLVALASLASAQQTITIDGAPWDGTNATFTSFEVPDGEVAEVLSIEPQADGYVFVTVYRGGQPVTSWSPTALRTDVGRTVVAGPARLELYNQLSSPAYFTLQLSPGQYPPGKSAVIGERDGPMKCTLEESTDLVNWTQSTSGQTHSLTNASAKKFFRIKLEQDVAP